MSGMQRFEHGGDIYTHVGVVDFSANINPLGMPEQVVEALHESVLSFDVYPDLECRELRAALSSVEGVPASQILCTSGASDLMHRVCLATHPVNALVTAPCFSGYEQALEQAGTFIWRHPLPESEGFEVTPSILESDFWEACASESKELERGQACRGLLFLCTPNNPTGLTIDQGVLKFVLDKAQAADVVVVLDECFLDFTDEPSAVPLCAAYPNLVVMRAFTKLYAMAGLRLGYGICANETLMAAMEAAGEPWAVSTPAQVAGVAALSDPTWADRTRAYVNEQRAYLEKGLRDCGLKVISGKANYLLLQSPRDLYQPLLERGFLIRRCANYVGLDQSWFRIAVRTARENESFLKALQEVVS